MFEKLFKIVFFFVSPPLFLALAALGWLRKNKNESSAVVYNNITINNVQDNDHKSNSREKEARLRDDDDDNDILYGRFRKR